MKQVAYFLALTGLLLAGCGTDAGTPTEVPKGPEPSPVVVVLAPTSSVTLAVNSTVPEPLRVQVLRGGMPVAGHEVIWEGTSGSFSPGRSITDIAGVASTQWNVGLIAGPQQSWARIATDSKTPVVSANLVAGPAAIFEKVQGDQQVLGAAAIHAALPLMASATDQYGNPISGVAWTWAVVSGPVELVGTPVTYPNVTLSGINIRGTGTPGQAVVTATPFGSSVHTTFMIEFRPGIWEVGIENVGYTAVTMRSYQNKTTPAVDTLPVGGTLIIRHRDYWDVIQGGQMELQGVPGGLTCPTNQVWEATCQVTFTTPGTFRYGHTLLGGLFGTVVVQ